MNKGKNSHMVFYNTNIQYDGRVSALINTLASAKPNDVILLLNFNYQIDEKDEWSENVKVVRNLLTHKFFKKNSFTKYLNFILYPLHSLWLLFKYRPKTIQLHHEVVLFAPLLYALIFKNVAIVYDDKEFYHMSDNNIPYLFFKIESWTLRRSELIIFPNLHRAVALKKAFNLVKDNFLIVNNFEFNNPAFEILNPVIVERITKYRQEGKRILLHQGFIDINRGAETLKGIVNYLPNDWYLCFIGISNDEFDAFIENLSAHEKQKLKYLGFINYNQLSSFYSLIDASVIFYGVNSFNNKYCAPNRLYSAANNGKPIIVNHDNVTLGEFIKDYRTGVALTKESDVTVFFKNFLALKHTAEKFKGQFQNDEVIQELYNFYLN